VLVLEDGRAFPGKSFGFSAERTGEVVFNTSMTGYQEILTDPSYRGQIVVLTVAEVGNYGVNEEDPQSAAIQAEGLIIRSLTAAPSNWRAQKGLVDYLLESSVPALTEVDTRALTRHIRSRGAMKGILSDRGESVESLARKARASPGLEEIDLVGRVTCPRPYRFSPSPPDETGTRIPILAYDLGMKQNILRRLAASGFDVTVVPAGTGAEEALASGARGIFLSNGPGDPASATRVVEAARGLVGRLPVFGICLGHQILGLALGAKTFKLKFGHRGGNQPVKDLATGRVLITAQNHGYAIDPDGLPAGAEVTQINLNDGTVEGFRHREMPLVSVQYHPEASPGPQDSFPLFDSFRALVLAFEKEIAAGRRAPAARRSQSRTHGEV
jgi:carbamoyl-phosphate synthase small subunit